jgi:protein TonB
MFPRVEGRELRALQAAVAASVALHAFVLFVLPGIRAPALAPALPTLTAVLRSPAPAARPSQVESSPPPPQEAKPVVEPTPKPVTPKVEPAKPPPPATPKIAVPAPAAPAASTTAAAPAATPAASPVSAPDTKAGTGTAPATPSTTVATAAPSAPSVSSSSSEPADPNALQGYKVQLAQFATKYKRYPATALQQHWEGIAEVKLTIGPDGRIRDAVIANSSGYEMLDKVAIEMVRKAAPLTEIKPSLRNKEFSVNLPIVFNIEHKTGG